MLENGRPVPGYKLVAKQARRQWVDKAKIEAWVDANNIKDAPEIGPRTFVLIEEFGTLVADANFAGNGDSMEAALTRLQSLSRATGIHLAYLDQTSQNWTRSMKSAETGNNRQTRNTRMRPRL